MKIVTKLVIQILSLIVLPVIFLNASYAGEITGTWQTVDDKTQEVRSLIELRIDDDKLYGKITKIFPQPGQPKEPTCDLCESELKGAPILGLQIINGLSLDDEVWKDGTILDPDNGKLYNCRIWLEGDVLKVRGYIGFFYGTQEWLRHTTSDSQAE